MEKIKLEYVSIIFLVLAIIFLEIACISYKNELEELKNTGNVSRETLYSELFTVKNIQELPNHNYIIVFENQNGYQFIWESNDGDFNIGEIYTAIMETNETSKIWDDEIFSIKYQGMLEKIKN